MNGPLTWELRFKRAMKLEESHSTTVIIKLLHDRHCQTTANCCSQAATQPPSSHRRWPPSSDHRQQQSHNRYRQGVARPLSPNRHHRTTNDRCHQTTDCRCRTTVQPPSPNHFQITVVEPPLDRHHRIVVYMSLISSLTLFTSNLCSYNPAFSNFGEGRIFEINSQLVDSF